MTTQSASLSDRGRRHNNEDFAAFFEPVDPQELKENGCLYIIADGVGGASQGERASQFAARKVLYEYYQSSNLQLLERLREIMERANEDIYAYAQQNHTRMATTMVMAIVREGNLYVANVGDSRAYLIRAGTVTQINRDHSIVGEMMAHGEMTEAEAMVSKIKNRLTRSLGGDPEVTVDVYPSIQLKTGDKILLCTDGLTRYALREDLAKMTAQGTNEEIARRLVKFANDNGGADNISVIVISYQDTSVLEPTVRIERPSQVELDSLITQPGEVKKTRPKKRQPMMTIALMVLFLGVVVAAWLVGGMLVQMLYSSFAPTVTTTPALAITPTDTQASAPGYINPPTFTPPSIGPTAIVATDTQIPTPKRPEATNKCSFDIVIRTDAGEKNPPFLEKNGTTAVLKPGDILTIVGKKIVAEVTDYNPSGIWLQVIYPRETELKNWINKFDCVYIDPTVFANLRPIP